MESLFDRETGSELAVGRPGELAVKERDATVVVTQHPDETQIIVLPDMREIWLMQPRFERRAGSTPLTLVEQPRFRAGFDFLRLRADAGEVDGALAHWWEAFSLADPDARRDMLEQVRTGEPRRRHAAPAAEGEAGEGGAPARKRRRRRRRPANDSAEEAAVPAAGDADGGQ